MRCRQRSTRIRNSLLVAATLAFSELSACGPPAVIGPEPNEPKTDPTAQGALEHRRDAKLEVARLAAHQREYDPRARETLRRCEPGRSEHDPGEPICWYETINPTAVHLQEIESHRLHAAYHRRAARQLTAAEESACKGIAKADRQQSPFSHRGDILGVAPFEVAVGPRRKDRHLAGATVIFSPVPGLNRDRLQQVMNCHIAQNAVLGFDRAAEEMPLCPLTLRGVQASVREVDVGFAVDVQSAEAGAAEVIWQRAQALAKVDGK